MKREHKCGTRGSPRVGGGRPPAPAREGSGAELGRFDAARARRAALARETEAVRLADGAGDSLPGIFVDAYLDCWVVSTLGGRFPGWIREAGGWRTCFWRRLAVGEKSPPSLAADHSGRVTEDNAAEFEVVVRERDLRFAVRPGAGYSCGLFLDQRENRAELAARIAARAALTGGSPAVLNTFAYTCAFSVVAARAGASVVSVDLSAPALDRGRANFALNSLDPAGSEFFKGDVFDWLPRFAKKGRRFDFILLDPPTFSRDAKGRVFQVARDYGRLLGLALDLAAEGAVILACANMAALGARAFRALITQVCAAKGRKAAVRPGRVPPDFTAPPLMKSFWIELDLG